MQLDQLLLLGILSAALHWLFARSEIARPLWSRARGMFAKLLACAGCSGWWIGTMLGALNVVAPIPFDRDTTLTGMFGVVAQAAVTGLLAIFLTPIFEAILLWGLAESALGVSEGAVPTTHDDVETPNERPPI